MNKSELQTILGYLNIGLAIAHSTGITVGHFGSTDFIQLAQAVNGLLLESIVPAASAATIAVAAPAAVATTAPAVAVAVASAPVASVAVANLRRIRCGQRAPTGNSATTWAVMLRAAGSKAWTVG
jgi:hypothetical protein